MFKKITYVTAIALLLAYAVSAITNNTIISGWLLMLFFANLSIIFRNTQKLKGFSFTTMIFAMVSLSMYYPHYFIQYGDFKYSKLILPLLQVIMFGMGGEFSLKEMGLVLKTPKAIGVGVICHYTIMPLIGFTIATVFDFPKEIAAGIILIGCCPSGLASNVMSYLARANLALSISVTAISTLLAPFLTPLLMRLLAGKFVAVHFGDMVWDTTKVVLIPTLAGLLFNSLFRGKLKWLDRLMPVISMAGIGLIIVVITAAGRDSLLKMGLLLILAVFIHNTAGYTFGYWLSR